MLEQLHRLFAYAIVFTVGLIVATIEVPLMAIRFIAALSLYLVMSITAPIWAKFDIQDEADFIKNSMRFKLVWTKKAMRAYRDALL